MAKAKVNEIPEVVMKDYSAICEEGPIKYFSERLEKYGVMFGGSNKGACLFFADVPYAFVTRNRWLRYAVEFNVEAEVIGRHYSKPGVVLNLGWYADRELYYVPVTITCEIGSVRDIRSDLVRDAERRFNGTAFEYCKYTVAPIPQPKVCNRILTDLMILNVSPSFPIDGQVEMDYPYAADMIAETEMSPIMFLMAKETEQLYKAGYVELVKTMVNEYRIKETNGIEIYNRLCKPGKNIKEIFNFNANPGMKAVCQTLKDSGNLKEWDIYRKMVKSGKISKDTIQRIYEEAISEKELALYSEVLAIKCGGKSPFTFDTLTNYINRVDTYEAIRREEALLLIRDYLRSCNAAGIKPRIDSDSLKREHDIAARLARYKMDTSLCPAIEAECEDLQNFDYSDGAFFIRAVRDYKDLIDEATQQRNCLAGYASSISKGLAKVFVMRRKECPEKSLITVELNGSMTEIYQKKMAYNRNIRNKSHSDFLEGWLRWIHSHAEEGADYQKIRTAYIRKYPEASYNREQTYRHVCVAMDKWYKTGNINEAVEFAHRTQINY